eukprot:Gregarina_sp_Poly_1__6450@NODE_344_length_9409_cov_268_562406_g288_i0_p7_GENE_NODE_344_length_9409_cov_268_562406_g288_i0NODE_344_length_9409_cov_268_562406_g288_i0_p7_ORF_typecomplete_len131_score12_09_NODE_344_length_9409_cov_268_562406_g288_i072477639
MPAILLGGAVHNIRLVANPKELQRYMQDLHYNVAVRVYSRNGGDQDSRAAPGAPLVVATEHPQDLVYSLQGIFLREDEVPKLYGYCLCYLPPPDVERLRSDADFAQVRTDVQRLRADVLGIVRLCEERDR